VALRVIGLFAALLFPERRCASTGRFRVVSGTFLIMEYRERLRRSSSSEEHLTHMRYPVTHRIVAWMAVMNRLTETLTLSSYSLFVQHYGGPSALAWQWPMPKRVGSLIVRNALAQDTGF
jgi:hypothetical protein